MSATGIRGYGYPHQLARRRMARVVDAGLAVCSRCGHPIVPGADWHLDHSDDRADYLGAAHALCNLRAGGRKGAAARLGLAVRGFSRSSRRW